MDSCHCFTKGIIVTTSPDDRRHSQLLLIVIVILFISIALPGFFTSRMAFASQGYLTGGSGLIGDFNGVEHRAKGQGADIALSLRIKLYAGTAPKGTPQAGNGSGAIGAAWDPNTDPAFQKALRDRLMSNDDSGAAGVNMDIVVGGASDGQRSARGTQMCVSNAQADGAGEDGFVPLPVFTLQDFQRLAVAPAESHVQPAPDTLKNMNTNVYAVAQPQTFITTLGGYPVSVRAYPVQYTWNYGDGATLGPTPLTGAPLADGQWDVPTDTSHVYRSTGGVSVVLTTSFYGEYNIADTGWQPVMGYNQVTSPPVGLSVWRATVHNVADDCRINPSSVGCPGSTR